MKNINKGIDEIEELDKCIFAGKDIVHYTNYKPDCKNCEGYNVRCEKEGVYLPLREFKTNGDYNLQRIK